MPMWNPILHFCSSTLGSSILDEFAPQIMLGPPSRDLSGKLKRVGRVAPGRPTLLNIAKGGRSSCWAVKECHLGSKMSSTRHVGDLKMNQYALWNTSSEAWLIHNHQNRWARELINTTSTYINSPIQALIYCHATSTIGWKSTKGGTFSNTYAHECSWKVCKYCSTRINSQNDPNLGIESPWLISACDKP